MCHLMHGELSKRDEKNVITQERNSDTPPEICLEKQIRNLVETCCKYVSAQFISPLKKIKLNKSSYVYNNIVDTPDEIKHGSKLLSSIAWLL